MSSLILGCYVPYVGICLPTFTKSLSVPPKKQAVPEALTDSCYNWAIKLEVGYFYTRVWDVKAHPHNFREQPLLTLAFIEDSKAKHSRIVSVHVLQFRNQFELNFLFSETRLQHSYASSLRMY